MIRHRELDSAKVLDMLRSGGQLLDKLDGHATDTERLEAQAELETVDSRQVVADCIGCGTLLPVLDMALCDCGCFVCLACQRIEDDGDCSHTRSEY